MSTVCQSVREKLAEDAADATVAVHLEGCAECAAIARALVDVDAGLAIMPAMVPSEELVARTLAAAEQSVGLPAVPAASAPIGTGALFAAAIAAIGSALGAVLAAPIWILRGVFGALARSRGRWVFALGGGAAACGALLMTMSAPIRSRPAVVGDALEAHGVAAPSSATAPADEPFAGTGPPEVRVAGGTMGEAAPSRPGAATTESGGIDTGGWRGPIAGELDRDERALPQGQALADGRYSDRTSAFDQPVIAGNAIDLPTPSAMIPPPTASPGARYAAPDVTGGDLTLGLLAQEQSRADDHWRGLQDGEESDREESEDAQHAQFATTWWNTLHAVGSAPVLPRDGWWANTYVPGDPALRALHAQLASAPAALRSVAEDAHPMAPGIEAPRDRAIAVGISADVRALEGPSRARIAIDLRAIEQSAGRRAPMRIAVVIDAQRALDEAEQTRVRALLAALGRAVGPRDRVTVFGAGVHGGALVPLGHLRHGEVEVALRRLFAGEGGDMLALERAVELAAHEVASEEDVGLVLLVTPDASHDQALDTALHGTAVAGVPTSCVAIGDRASLADVDAIALAGQGRRRIVRNQTDADAVARAEIEAASQLVARALRLRIRLAPGVELHDVLGSYSLDEVEVNRTREAERAVDHELARRLGIESDRDDDDTGIRVLIPAFYAGDSHTVLLDVTAAGPGPIAEVDVRFKDLVRIENGVASAALSIRRGTPTRGPREVRVVSALLTQRASDALADAASAMRLGDGAGAVRAIDEALGAIESARVELSTLGRERSVRAVSELLARYRALCATSTDSTAFVTSARVASRRLLLRPRLAASGE